MRRRYGMGEVQMRAAVRDGGADTAVAEPAKSRRANAATAVACVLVLAGCRPGRADDRFSLLRDRLRRCGAAPVVVLLAMLCACQPYDPGGSVRERMVEARAAQKIGARVEIRGACYSACALKLASGRGLCVSRSAVIGVHEVREAVLHHYADGARDD